MENTGLCDYPVDCVADSTVKFKAGMMFLMQTVIGKREKTENEVVVVQLPY